MTSHIHPAASAMATAVLSGDYAAARALADWLVSESGFDADWAYYLIVGDLWQDGKLEDHEDVSIVAAPSYLSATEVIAAVEPQSCSGWNQSWRLMTPDRVLAVLGGAVKRNGRRVPQIGQMYKFERLFTETVWSWRRPLNAEVVDFLWRLITPPMASYLLPFAQSWVESTIESQMVGLPDRAAIARLQMGVILDRLSAIAASSPQVTA